MNPLISVVIPTKNSDETLRACLESMKSQTYANYELIIVDASSTDSTKDIAAAFGATLLTSDAPLPAARNLGYSKARGGIFVSIDSDMLLEATVLEDIVRGMKAAPVLIIPETGYGDDFISRCRDLEKRCYIGDEDVEAARAFSRQAFEAVGGYDASLHLGEDADMHDRLKRRFPVGRIRSKVMHDTRGLSFLSALRKSYGYGKTLGRYLAKKPTANRRLSPQRLFFFRHFHKLAREPLLALGLLFMKGAQYSAMALGFLTSRPAKSP